MKTVCIRILKFIVNWVLILSMPIWGGSVAIYLNYKQATPYERKIFSSCMKGIIWIWEIP